MKSLRSFTVSVFVLTLMIGGGLLVWFNRFWLYDQVMITQYPPSSAARQLAQDTKMTEPARAMFYGARADLNSVQDFQSNCSGEEAQTIVLGCFVGTRIYILNVNDPRIKEVEEVTAAHEMLHVAYERLSSNEKKQLHTQLESAYKRVKDERLESLMKSYAQSEPGQHYNELHSILGTEYHQLGAELDKYYARYFSDRERVVDLAQSYQAVFDDLKKQQVKLIAELQELSQRIDLETSSYNAELEAFNADVADFNVRASAGNGDFNELTRERNQLLAQQERLESLRVNILAQRDEYEAKRKQYNELIVTSQSLQSSLKGLSEAPTKGL